KGGGLQSAVRDVFHRLKAGLAPPGPDGGKGGRKEENGATLRRCLGETRGKSPSGRGRGRVSPDRPDSPTGEEALQGGGSGAPFSFIRRRSQDSAGCFRSYPELEGSKAPDRFFPQGWRQLVPPGAGFGHLPGPSAKRRGFFLLAHLFDGHL